MASYSLSHLSDGDLLRALASLVAHDRATTARLLAHVAEVDERKLYLPAAYPSMYAYCVHELHLSEDAAYRRITAARTAGQFPVLFGALADGRIHLATVGLLAPFLNSANVEDLLRAVAQKSKSEVEQLLAERFPRSEMLPLVETVPTLSCQLVPGRVGTKGPEATVTERVAVASQSHVAPIASQRYALHFNIGQSAHDKLRRAQDLLSHQVPSGDVAAVIERALDALIARLEKEAFAATDRPQSKPRPTTSRRHIPANVKRAVRERDGDQCTFVSEAGSRCPAKTLLEFDHIDPVARGGAATVDNLRLRCRAHNDYAAECEFGRKFMEGKRQEARREADAKARAKAAGHAREANVSPELDVVPWLRQLGYRADEARRAAEFCESIPNASLEDRIRRALSYFKPKTIGGRSARANT